MLDKFSKTTNCLVMQGSQPVSRYLVVREDTERPILVAAGRFEHDDLETLVEHARQQLSEQGLKVAQAILLLPRGDVEVNSLELPPATEDELPELVANLLAQQADDSTELFANDFLVTNEKDTNNAQKTEGTGGVPEPAATDDDFTDAASHEVVTFSVPQATVDSWSQRFKEQGFRLQAVTFGGLGAVHLLGQVSTKPARTSIVVTTTDQDTDLAVVENGLPILFRTIPRATGGEQFVTEQLAGEIQRTLALVGHPDDEQTRVYLIGTMDEQEDTATLLSDKLSLAVTLVNPFDQLRGNQKVDRPSRFANLIGTACAANQNNLSVDLLNPRQPKAQPSVWHRYGFWAIVASLLLAVCGYLLLEQGADQRAEIEAKQVQFNRLVKRAKKAQSKVKITSAIDNWRDSEICWLDELNFLSSKLPPPDEVTINSLTMAAGSVPKQRGRMDMSVEVSDPSVRLAMEHAIRDDRHTPTSKRVTDASNRSGSAWRFQTIVTVAPQRVKLTSAATAPASAKNKTKSEPAKSEPAKSKPGTSDSDLRSSVSTPTEAAEGEVNHGE